MELFRRVDLLALIFKDDDALTLIKGEVDCFLAMSQDKHFFNLGEGKGNESFQGLNAYPLIDFSNGNKLFVDQ